MAGTISKGLEYIITLYTITSLAYKDHIKLPSNDKDLSNIDVVEKDLPFKKNDCFIKSTKHIYNSIFIKYKLALLMLS